MDFFISFVKFILVFFISIGLVFGFITLIQYLGSVESCKVEYIDSSGQKQVINSSENLNFRLGTRSLTIIDKINDTKKTIYGDFVIECKN